MAARRKYWWEEWFGRPRTTLVAGADYYCSQSAMVNMIRVNASKRAVRVRLTDNRDSITIEVVGEISRPNKTSVAG